MAAFLNERWKGMYPIAWGDTLAEVQFTSWLYKGVCGLQPGKDEENDCCNKSSKEISNGENGEKE